MRNISWVFQDLLRRAQEDPGLEELLLGKPCVVIEEGFQGYRPEGLLPGEEDLILNHGCSSLNELVSLIVLGQADKNTN